MHVAQGKSAQPWEDGMPKARARVAGESVPSNRFPVAHCVACGKCEIAWLTCTQLAKLLPLFF